MSLADILTFPDALSREQCAEVREFARGVFPIPESQYGKELAATACSVHWLPIDSAPRSLVDCIESLFRRANAHFGFDVRGVEEDLKVLSYEAGQEIPWHQDCGPSHSATRKLSISIPLVSDTQYEGGVLEFHDMPSPRLGLGEALVFPSFRSHRVTRVKRGRRIVLVAWAHGPVFR